MNDALVQNWVKEIVAQDELARAQSELDAKESLLAAFTARAEVPVYMTEFARELALYSETLRGIGLDCAFSDFSEPGFETRCQVMVRLSGALMPRYTYTNVFHLIGNNTIRCHSLGGKVFTLDFAVRPEGNAVALSARSSLSLMNPKEAARFVVEPMVKWVRGRYAEVY